MIYHTPATLIGSVGVALLLIAFLLNLLKILRSDGHLYTSLNLVGAGMACYSSYLIRFMPFVVLEAVWASVALAAIAWALFLPAKPTAHSPYVTREAFRFPSRAAAPKLLSGA